jgi:hypothetical protein
MPEGKRFEVGKSGNPSGMSKAQAEVRRLAQAAGPDAIRGLIALANGKKVPAAVRRQSWVDLLDRGFGKPTSGESGPDGEQIIRILTGVARAND